MDIDCCFLGSINSKVKLHLQPGIRPPDTEAISLYGQIFGRIPGPFRPDAGADSSNSVSGRFWPDTESDSSDSVSGRFGCQLSTPVSGQEKFGRIRVWPVE